MESSRVSDENLVSTANYNNNKKNNNSNHSNNKYNNKKQLQDNWVEHFFGCFCFSCITFFVENTIIISIFFRSASSTKTSLSGKENHENVSNNNNLISTASTCNQILDT